MIDRMALLEWVAEGGREIAGQWLPGEMTEHDRATADYKDAYASMIELMRPLIHALDAHLAEPVGETVEVRVAVWRHRRTGDVETTSEHARMNPTFWERIATITAHVPLPTIPTVAARVET